MKIGIVTVYSSMNCGSFLQAYALGRTLERQGHEAVYIHHNFPDHSSYPLRYGKKILKSALRGRFSMTKRLIRRRKMFRQAIQLLNVQKNPKNLDCCIVGSDTIWDLSVSFFRNHRDFFWGTDFGRVISYAPSMGYSQQVDPRDREFITGALGHMRAVSVRDQYALEMLQPYCDSPICMVCDPTILLMPEDYAKIAKPLDMENFIFLYCYGPLPHPYVQALRAYADAHKLKIVTMGSENSWCDVCLSYDPLLFVSLYEKAASIVTNTFHGTVFANIFEKKFLIIENKKPKVIDFLKLCRMEDKMSRQAEDVTKILDSHFSYDVTREILAAKRKAGIDYLTKGLSQ